MKIAYIYPESLPSQKARAISVVNSSNEIAKLSKCTLFIEDSSNIQEVYQHYNLHNTKLIIKPVSKTFLAFKSNKFFNRNLLKQLKKDNFDIIYVRHLKVAHFLIKKGFNVIFECHEIFFKSNQKVKVLEEYIYKNSKGLVFINKTLQKEFQREFSISEIPQKIIHNGTNFNFNYIKKDFHNINRLYYIGNFYKWKGVEFLINTMCYYKSLELKLIGTGEEETYLKKLVSQLGLEDNIKFLGFKKSFEVKEVLLSSKITIIPNIPSKYSKYSSPIKLYEYMATSNIVIAADMDTIKEIVIDGENGFLFKSGDLESLKETINRVLSLSHEELQQIAKNAYETSKSFTWAKRGENIVEFSKGLIK